MLFVVFHVRWALSALELPVSAKRVVYLSVEQAFAALTYGLAQSAKLAPNNKIKLLFKKQEAPLDRRWPAVLFEVGIEFRQYKCDNVYVEEIF